MVGFEALISVDVDPSMKHHSLRIYMLTSPEPRRVRKTQNTDIHKKTNKTQNTQTHKHLFVCALGDCALSGLCALCFGKFSYSFGEAGERPYLAGSFSGALPFKAHTYADRTRTYADGELWSCALKLWRLMRSDKPRKK